MWKVCSWHCRHVLINPSSPFRGNPSVHSSTGFSTIVSIYYRGEEHVPGLERLRTDLVIANALFMCRDRVFKYECYYAWTAHGPPGASVPRAPLSATSY